MELSNCKPKIKTRKDRIKTLCTLDTYDVNFGDSYYRKGKENDIRSRNCPYNGAHSRSTTNKKASTQHQKSQFSAYNCSRVREGSLGRKGKRATSISQSSVNRVRTQYADFQPNATRGIMTPLKKKLVFALQDSYKFGCMQVVKRIHESKDEEVMLIKQQSNEKDKSLMIKMKNNATRRYYQKEMKVVNSLILQLKGKEKGGFLKIRKVVKEKSEWIAVTDKYYHASWENGQFYMFISQFKNSQADLITLIRQMAKNIQVLSKYNYSHNCICLQSINFPVGKTMLKLGETIKLGNLQHLSLITNKESFLSLPNLFRTPPEILNFIMFQCMEDFDRDYLDEISKLSMGWQVDMWALGILILQLLNGGPLSGQGSDRSELISLQKQLTIRYSYLLINLQSNLKMLILKMLSPFPLNRPHPKQILRLL